MKHESIGTEVDYSDDKRKKKIRGMIIGARRSAKTVLNITTGEKWLGLEFKISPNDGSRVSWTGTFKDLDAPVVQPGEPKGEGEGCI